MPFIKPVQLPDMYLAEYMESDLGLHISSDFDNYEQYEIALQFSINGDIDYDLHLLPLLESGRMDTFQHGCSLTGARLCEFCGSAVEGDGACPLCGGYALPFSELVKIDRNCAYCGKKVANGLVCRDCGAKLSGLTYREMIQ